jgi:hypothetical protein
VSVCPNRVPADILINLWVAGVPDLAGARRRLFDLAPRLAAESGRQLVLLVDGLENDLDDEISIASRLPVCDLKVVVSSRQDYRLPRDVPPGHPLRHCPTSALGGTPRVHRPRAVSSAPVASALPVSHITMPETLRIVAIGFLVFAGVLLFIIIGFVVRH